MKNYLIIGASSGIGAQLAETLASKGNQVYGTYNTHAKANGQNITMAPYNVLEEGAELSFLPEVLDGFIYCPGSINLKPFARIPAQDFTKDFELQVTGAIKSLQMVLPKLKASASPSVVFFSTVAVQTGLNFHSQVSASKGAIEGLTRALAAELAPKIRVNCIAPSLTNTPLAAALLSSAEKEEANAQRHPLKRVGTAADIASMAAFLLSEDASWITGQVMKVDGGMGSIK